MMASNYLFVYGTLRRRYKNDYAKLLRGHAEFVGLASMRGILVDVGRYPAVIKAGKSSEIVYGELYKLKVHDKIFRELDQYEGDEYERKKIQVSLLNGDKVESWVYTLKFGTPYKNPIKGGDYTKYSRTN